MQVQEQHLDHQLKRTEDKLGQLEQEHERLKGSSVEEFDKLRGEFGTLQRHCDELEVIIFIDIS